MKGSLWASKLLMFSLIVFAFCGKSYAENQYLLTTGFVSHHAKGEYRENNYGIGLEVRPNPQLSYNVGYYRNSLDRDSYYAGVQYRAITVGNFAFGGMVGAVTGYRHSITPMALPFVEWSYKRVVVMATAIPPIPGVTPFTMAVQLKWRFK